MASNKVEALVLISHARKLAQHPDLLNSVERVTLRSALEEAERLISDLQEVKRARRPKAGQPTEG